MAIFQGFEVQVTCNDTPLEEYASLAHDEKGTTPKTTCWIAGQAEKVIPLYLIGGRIQ